MCELRGTSSKYHLLMCCFYPSWCLQLPITIPCLCIVTEVPVPSLLLFCHLVFAYCDSVFSLLAFSYKGGLAHQKSMWHNSVCILCWPVLLQGEGSWLEQWGLKVTTSYLPRAQWVRDCLPVEGNWVFTCTSTWMHPENIMPSERNQSQNASFTRSVQNISVCSSRK